MLVGGPLIVALVGVQADPAPEAWYGCVLFSTCELYSSILHGDYITLPRCIYLAKLPLVLRCLSVMATTAPVDVSDRALPPAPPLLRALRRPAL